MKKNRLSLAFLGLLIAASPLRAQDTPQTETAEQKDKRMEWFSQAKLGIFIHWGIYSVRGVSESWSFFNNYLPYDEYMEQEKGFTASKYDPKNWVDLIKESGAKYTVITTKHHDGVALWDTKVGDISVVKSTPAKRDLIAPFVKEVRKQGLKLGFYYSLLDWSHPDYPNKTRTEVRYKNDPERWARFNKFNFGQLAELNKTWKPDLYWFDGDWEQSSEAWNSKGIVDLLRSDNKNVIINLTELHNALSSSPKFPFYSAAYFKALPFIVELRNKNGKKDEPELETCFEALYGVLLLRLQKKSISEGTAKAVEAITSFLSMLANYYDKDRKGELKLDE